LGFAEEHSHIASCVTEIIQIFCRPELREILAVLMGIEFQIIHLILIASLNLFNVHILKLVCYD